MNFREVIRLLYDCLYWFLLAAIIGVPFVMSLYVMVTPRHRLLEAWQNFRMRQSKKVLKDRHFKNMPRILALCKVLSIFVFIASAWTICWELDVIDFWPPEDWWNMAKKYF